MRDNTAIFHNSQEYASMSKLTKKPHRGSGSSSKCGIEKRLRLSGWSEALERRVLLSTFTVANLNDSGAGSLRQAIMDANAAAGADMIEFQGVSGTITLTSGQLKISDGLTINGPGMDVLAVSGNIAS